MRTCGANRILFWTYPVAGFNVLVQCADGMSAHAGKSTGFFEYLSAAVGGKNGILDGLIHLPWYAITRPFTKSSATLVVVGLVTFSIPMTLWLNLWVNLCKTS